MNNINKAFTLIELIVVISIIAIISSSGVFYFLDFVKSQEISQKISIIEDDLNDLDKQIKDYKIFDYELFFNTSNTGSKSYITYINNFDTINQILQITNDTGSGIVKTEGTTGSGIIKIYKNHKLFVNNEINRANPFEFNFNENLSYKITGTQSGETLNEIQMKYFSENNLYPEKNDNLELVRISETETGNDLGNIIIKNIGGNKKFYNNGSEYISNEIYLHFENSGKEKFIKIIK